ncbi:MAG: CRTAC1 family protein [Saprospiraceae bacterium]
MARILTLVFLASFLWMCNDAPSPIKKAGQTAANGHERMVQLLDSIARNADPNSCYNLNSKMAAQYEAQLASITDPNQRVVGQFKVAEQLLYAGKTERATMILSEISQLIGDEITPGTKPIFDYLALSYLRLGEQQNCIDKHTAESCILPIQGEGVYSLPSGPENAIKVYKRILEQYPKDLDSRWLLNIAYMNLGQYPQNVPPQYLIPTKVFQNKGNIRFKDIAIPLGLDLTGLSGGVCMEDFDQDGDLDLFMTSYGLTDPCHYFENKGDGTFTEKTHEANLDGIVSGLNTLHADYDNDGDRDILVLRGGWLDGGTHPNSLLRNNGDGTFTDVTIDAGILSFHPTQAASWADYDGDGWLDLYIANESKRNQTPHPNELYHNNGDGTFTNVAAALKLNLTGFFKAVVWGDINNDQRPDLYLSNLSDYNLLLVNRGGTAPDQWAFENISEKAGVGNPLRSFPSWFFDYNNDGYEDILVCGYIMASGTEALPDYINEILGKPSDADVLRLYRNNGDETFTDVHREAGLHKVNFAMGCNFGDLDNDGWIDFYLGSGIPDLRGLLPNRMFRNVQGKRFEELTMNGFGHLQKGHGVAFGDIDNDGDQDIYAIMGGAYEGDLGNNVLFENPGTQGHWLSVDLVGQTVNKDAIGGKIAVTVKQANGQSRTIYASVNTGGSFGAASLRQEIGLGDATEIQSVEISWPKSGTAHTILSGVPMDKHIRVNQGKDGFEVLDLKAIDF